MQSDHEERVRKNMGQALALEKISKKYTIQVGGGSDRFGEALLKALGNTFGLRHRREEILWALKDVSFTVDQGEVVGIIGRNGAGKSTLLKVLSRITYPTYGTMRVDGRVGSLLEVGTGFHEDLSGRENIFLNGSILGMTKKQIQARMDTIINFAEVERFIDTPIKRYSTGMKLRLGFSVAAHLDTDILFMDEVLAVGDAGFQKKCLNSMSESRKSGRTILFVSHNMAAVESLCSRAIWIEGGKVQEDGQPTEVIQNYMGIYGRQQLVGNELADLDRFKFVGTGEMRYTKVEFLEVDGSPKNIVRSGDTVLVRLHYMAYATLRNPDFNIKICNEMGTYIAIFSTKQAGIDTPLVVPGEGYIDLEIGPLTLVPGRYFLDLTIAPRIGGSYELYYGLVDFVEFSVETTGRFFSGIEEKKINSALVFFPNRWNLEGMNLAPGQSA